MLNSRETEQTEEQRQAGDTTLQEATVEDSREAEKTGGLGTDMDWVEFEEMLGHFVSGRVGCFCCTNCSYTAKKAEHVAEHAESCHIQGYSVSCSACSKVFRTRVGYRLHSCHTRRSARHYQVISCAAPLLCHTILY